MASRRCSGAVGWLLLCLGGCAVPAYCPCPLDLPSSLPADAFARCREVLLRHYGPLAFADEARFRMQTDWQPTAEPPGERRASVFLDQSKDRSLAIVVEQRRLTVPWFGPPRWTEPRGHDAAERELVEWLREVLSDAAPPASSLTDPNAVSQSR